MRYAFILILSFGTTLACSQDLFEGFEDSDLAAWEILRGEAELVNGPIIEGLQALQLGSADLNEPESIIIHRTFSDNYGTYRFGARADGSDSDADFYFQFLDLNNYYILSNKPANTDNPEFSLSKVVQGQVTQLVNLAPVVGMMEWARTSIERTCEGLIIVRVGDVEVINILDDELMMPGTVGFRSWGQFSFFDSLSFTKGPPVFESQDPEMIQTCTGSGFAFGNRIYTIDGLYSDTLTTTAGCDSVITIDLEFVDNVTVDTIFRICPGDSILVGSIYYSNEDSFTEVLSTSAGCDSTINFEVEFSSTITSVMDTLICVGDSILIDDQLISSSGMFEFSYNTSLGCDSIVTWNVQYRMADLDLGGNAFICPGETLALMAGQFESYLWSDQSSDDQLIVDQPGTYSVTVQDVFGCFHIDSVLITEQCALVILGANIFTPNGDGINDTWMPSFSRMPTEYSLKIYDRWGNLMFSTSNISESWSGEFNGESLSSGVYTWQVVADNQSQIGDVTIIR